MKNVNKPNTIAERLAKIEAQKQELLAKQAALEAEAAEAQAEANNKIAETIRGLPAVLGVATLDEVSNLIRQVNKGTFGSLKSSAPRAVRTVLSDEEKSKLVGDFKVGGPGNQRSELAARYSVSDGTVFNILKAAGLTGARAVILDAPVEAKVV